jgi:hypothetical protein
MLVRYDLSPSQCERGGSVLISIVYMVDRLESQFLHCVNDLRCHGGAA